MRSCGKTSVRSVNRGPECIMSYWMYHHMLDVCVMVQISCHVVYIMSCCMYHVVMGVSWHAGSKYLHFAWKYTVQSDLSISNSRKTPHSSPVRARYGGLRECKVWPKFFHCDCLPVSSMTAKYRESIVSTVIFFRHAVYRVGSTRECFFYMIK